MSRSSLNPLNWFRSKPSREDELTELIVKMALNGIVPFLGTCCASAEEVRLSNPRVGSMLVLAYITGYARAVHGFVETSSGIPINDANAGILTIQGVFFKDSLEAAADASRRTQLALGSEDDGGAREAWLMGKQDFESLSDNEPFNVSGLVKILGIGASE